ncbi:MAG TPA: SprB repeat-containing protein, partial [Flavobacteriales bacterium]|nr:SprB repeat-containing protein [Flavobacteriales bacterium]
MMKYPILLALVLSTLIARANLTAGIYNYDAATCGHNTGYAIVQASGGLPPYTYLWSTSATTDTITGLAPGNYSVTVTDANSDEVVANVTIYNEPNPVYTDISPGAGLHGCHGLCNNGIWYYEEYMPLNLVPPFSFSPEPVYGLDQMNPERGAWVGLCDGTQTYTIVTDALGCVAQLVTDMFTHGSDPGPMSVVSTQPSCEGMSGGVMTVNVGYEFNSAYTPLWSSTLLD